MKPLWIARQSRLPVGFAGEVIARIMSWDTRAANAFALAQLQVEPHHAVLEIGCGAGRTLAKLARRAAEGFVAGIDPSDVMVRLATRRLLAAIEGGRTEVRRAEAAHLPFEDARFDAALAVHVLHFWPDPLVELREIRRVLRPGGALVLGFRPDDRAARESLPGSVYHLHSVPAIEKLLREAGFEDPQAAETPSGTTFACLSARAAAGG